MNDKYVLPQAAQDTLGGIKAAAVEDKYTQECRIDKETGKLYTRSADRFLIEDTFEGNPVMSNSCREGNISLIEGYGESTQATTTGKNVIPTFFDAWESGDYNESTGEKIENSSKVRTKNLCTIDFTSAFTFSSDTTFRIFCRGYDESGAFQANIGELSYTEQKNIPTYVKKLGFVLIKENDTTFSEWQEIFNNLKMMVCNGALSTEYEPYTGGQPSPSPDYPQEVKSSVVTGVKVTNGAEQEQSLVLTTPVTLRGIPSETGNVTIDGQKYLSDYIGQKEGVYGVFRKTQEFVLDNQSDWTIVAPSGEVAGANGGYKALNILTTQRTKDIGLCNQGIVIKIGEAISSTKNAVFVGFVNTYIYFLNNDFYSIDLPDRGIASWKAHLAENPLKIITVADEETFEPLPEADQQALKDLKTFYPSSVINWETEDGSGAWGKAILKQDMKLYIQNKIKELSNNSVKQIQNINKVLLE